MLGSIHGDFSTTYLRLRWLSTTLWFRSGILQETVTSPLASIGSKSIVLVGLMGAGKSTVGRRLARRLDVPFADADDEIALAAGCSIPELFETYGEAEFRAGERRVIARLLSEDPKVLATGGGAFMDAETRERIRERAISVWLRATLETLVDRTIGRTGRPLLKDRDPTEILDKLMKERYPTYAEAELIVDTGDGPADRVVQKVLDSLAAMKGSADVETRA